MPLDPSDAPAGVTAGPDDDVAAVARPRGRRPLVLVVGLAAVVLVVDQLTKAWALRTLAEGGRRPLLGDLLGLALVFNSGAALSIATKLTWVLTLVALAVVVVVIRMSRRLGSTLWVVTLGLLLGGAVGNLVDRFARPPGPGRGQVVDFIAYGNVFVGNVADVAIVVAAGLVIIQTLRGVGMDGTRSAGHERDDPAADDDPPTDDDPDGGPTGSDRPDGDATGSDRPDAAPTGSDPTGGSSAGTDPAVDRRAP